MEFKPQHQHDWLQKFVGDWAYDAECQMGPEQATFSGTETVRSIGGLWIVGESTGEMPGGGAATMLLTLGFNPATQRFVGTWIGSMMPHLWTYTDGTLEGDTLTLPTTGPDCTSGGNVMKSFREVTTFHGDDERVFTSSMQGDDGTWKQLMTVRSRRARTHATKPSDRSRAMAGTV